MPESPQPAAIVRGPLKYVVETSTPQTEAGKEFSVSVRITNPYEVPVTIRRVVTKLPAKFITAEAEAENRKKNHSPEFGIRISGISLSLPGGSVVQATGGGVEHEADVPLQPGNSTVRVFTIRTVNATFFVPSLYNLNIEIEYVMDGEANHDTVAYQMNIRAPLGAIITGAIVGAIIGYVVRVATDEQSVKDILHPTAQSITVLRFFLGLVTSVLIAGMVVVAFARKKDAQPILSIEDFWGGLFIGFLSAYGGTALLSKATGAPAVGAASSAA